jgi:N-acetylneuraminic acid mutarotase
METSPVRPMLVTKSRFRLTVAVLAITTLMAALLPTAFAGSSDGSWEQLADANVARQEASYVNAGNKLYLMGWAKATHVYNPKTDSWVVRAAMPIKLDHMQAVTVGGKIYMMGGLTTWPDGDVDTVYIYDPGANAWTQGASFPAGRGRGASGIAVRDGKIYVAGGLHGGTAVPWVDVYDPATDSWSSLPDMPRAREHFHAAIVGGKLWAIGGRQGPINTTVGQTDAFNFSTGTWETGFAQIPTQRGGYGVGVSGDEIIVFGGEGGGTAHAEVEAYDVSEDSWRSLTSMPVPRHGIQVAECGGAFYIATGGTKQGGGGATTYHDVFRLTDGAGCGTATTTTTTTTTPPPVCTGADNAALDEDGDGFDNADEIDNGTDPCDEGSTPPDNDGDGNSDRNDADDDNDGKPDVTDAFAIDADNGTSTDVPVSMSWSGPDGGIAGTGFTGLMKNGSTNYQQQYNAAKVTLGSSLTIDGVPPGDAYKLLNNQRFGFQLGVMPTAGKFTASTTLEDPFGGLSPAPGQSMGLFVGTGSQSGYVKLVAQGDTGGRINLTKEIKDALVKRSRHALAMPGPDSVELFLTINPVAGTVKGSFVATIGGVAGPRTKLSKPIPIPASWYDGSKALAVGIISTSRGSGAPFPATWGSLEVVGGNGG